MAGTMRPNEMNMSTTPTTSTNQLPSLNVQTDVTKKPSTPRAPRIDVEPLYAAVKGSISDPDWTTYKQSLSSFLLGNLNQEELSRTLSKILTTPTLEHAHNALFTAIYANIWRDSPEAGIASWVSSSDKPTSGTVKGTHDEGEKRLKHEIMQLSRRERKRLKTIPASEGGAPESSWGPSGVGPTEQYFDARKAKQPELGPGGGNQGGGFGKTSTFISCISCISSHLTLPVHALILYDRLGSRNPQTLHRPPLLRNPRIPHNPIHPRTPHTHMLRARPTARPLRPLPRIPQPRRRNIHQRSTRVSTR
jgi:transcriptional coactivator HFI1/ADA1